MLATLIALYIIMTYVFELEKETVYKLVLTAGLLNLVPIVLLILFMGFHGEISTIILLLVGF